MFDTDIIIWFVLALILTTVISGLIIFSYVLFSLRRLKYRVKNSRPVSEDADNERIETEVHNLEKEVDQTNARLSQFEVDLIRRVEMLEFDVDYLREKTGMKRCSKMRKRLSRPNGRKERLLIQESLCLFIKKG